MNKYRLWLLFIFLKKQSVNPILISNWCDNPFRLYEETILVPLLHHGQLLLTTAQISVFSKYKHRSNSKGLGSLNSSGGQILLASSQAVRILLLDSFSCVYFVQVVWFQFFCRWLPIKKNRVEAQKPFMGYCTKTTRFVGVTVECYDLTSCVFDLLILLFFGVY